MVSPMSLTEKIKPIMPLRHGHLAQLSGVRHDERSRI